MSNNCGANDQAQANYIAQQAMLNGAATGVTKWKPPTAVEQLQKRKAELEAFLTIDHATKIRLAQEELSRVSNALECLGAVSQ